MEGNDMNVDFEKVIDGVTRYINGELIPGMNQVQEFATRLMLARIIRNQEAIKSGLISNPFIRTFGVIDDEGMVDVSELAEDIKHEIKRVEKLSFSVPFFGDMTFRETDVDQLYQMITGEEMNNNANY